MMSEILISAVQERHALWDKRNKSYHNRLMSHRQWEEVAKIIDTSVDVAKKKWKNLRDTFAKEMKKISKPRSGTDADNEPEYKGTWPYFEAMSFLIVILKPRKPEGNIQPEHSSESSSTDFPESTYASLVDELDVNIHDTSTSCTSEYDAIDINHETPGVERSHQSVLPPLLSPATETRQNDSIPSASSTTPRQKRKQKDDGLEAFLELEREKLKVMRQDHEGNNDEDLLWFKSVLPYMKQLPSLNKLHFRTKMQEMLLAELSQLNMPQVSQTNSQHSYLNL